MSRQTEKVFKQLNAYLTEHEGELQSEEDVNRLVEAFMAKQNAGEIQDERPDAGDYLEMAQNARSKKKRLEYLQKAREAEPENFDVLLAEAQEESKDVDELRERLAALMSHADDLMQEYLKNDAGNFWMVLETRPYMRLRHAYLDTLIQCGMKRLAIAEGKEMLRLCESDNLGVRFTLMHLYAALEEDEPMLALHERYEAYEETQMLLPLAAVYYRKGQMDKARDYLLRLKKVNPDLKRFIRLACKGDLRTILDELPPYGYRPFTLEELAVEWMDYPFLFMELEGFLNWAQRQLAKTKK